MLGALIGDIVGSVHEFEATKTKEFPLLTRCSEPTDDSYLTLAVARTLLDGVPYVQTIREMHARHPDAGWGAMFDQWASSDLSTPYNSYGNGSAMRVSPVGFAFGTEAETLREAERSAAVTHNHPEGVKGAQATALAIFLARQQADKEEIRRRVAAFSGYDLGRTCAEIRPEYQFSEICQTSVPEAIIAFLDSTDFEDAIRNAISLGGDADTQAAIAGPIAEAHYGPSSITPELRACAQALFEPSEWSIVERFREKFLTA